MTDDELLRALIRLGRQAAGRRGIAGWLIERDAEGQPLALTVLHRTARPRAQRSYPLRVPPRRAPAAWSVCEGVQRAAS